MPHVDVEERRAYHREYMRKYRAKNGIPARVRPTPEEQKASNRAYARAYRLRHRERVLGYQRSFQDRHRDEIRSTAREHDRTSPVRQLQKRLALHAYRQRHNNPARYLTPGTEAYEYAAIILGDPCSYCGEPSTEIDHIVPITQGGTLEWDNLTPSCATCNRSKQAKSLLSFLSRRAGLLTKGSIR